MSKTLVRICLCVALAGCSSSAATSAQTDAASADLAQADVATADAAPDLLSAELPAEVPPPETLGGDRPAAVHVPDDYSSNKTWPLILLLHGYSATGGVQDLFLGLSARATQFGFVEVVPEGLTDPAGNQYWNATPACCDFAPSGVDDLGYLKGLLSEAITKLHADPSRIYVVGHSNGGFMAHRLACEAADQITAIASIAGSMAADTSTCKPSRPVSVLQIHGTADTTIPFGGKGGPAGSGVPTNYPSADAIVAAWQGLDGCGSEAAAGAALDFDLAVASAETEQHAWTGCQQGSRVDLWKMNGSKHIPGFSNDFRDALVTHLLALKREP